MYDATYSCKVTANQDGDLIREFDKNSNRTTLITDEVVYIKEALEG